MKTLRTLIRLVEEYAIAFISVIFLDQLLYDATDWYGLDEYWMYYATAAGLFLVIKIIDHLIAREKKEISLI